MAIYETRPDEREADAYIQERIEVRPWWVGGERGQEFVIGGGGNFGENCNILIEIIYSVNDVQLFYTRNFIHHVEWQYSMADLLSSFKKFESGETNGFGFGDMLPDTSVILRRTRHSDGTADAPQTSSSYELEIAADIGACIGRSGPAVREIKIRLDIEEQDGLEFMRQLVGEITALYDGKHPDPARFAPGSSTWPFARRVNQLAYDAIAQTYEEDYFSEPLLTGMFDAWLEDLPAGGHILDLGCGHGKPVIERLTQKGFHVTGADLSPQMLERARQNFPDVTFINQLAGELTFDSEFDGACSLSSLLYLDPVDLSQGLFRLHCALKPEGLLFLHAYDLHPGYRGLPYHKDMNQWMWGWTYGLDEAVRILEEHGYFKVLQAREVTSEQEKQERIDKWYQRAQEQYQENIARYPNSTFTAPDRNRSPRLSYKYVIVAQAGIK